MKLSTLILIILIAVAIAAVCLFLGYLGYNTPLPFNDWYNAVAGWISNFNVLDMLKNPATILAAVGGIAAVAIPLYSKLSAAKQKITQVTDTAESKISSLTTEKDELQKKVAALEAETKNLGTLQTQADKASELQTKLNELQTNFDSISQQKTSYQNQYEELKAQLKTAQDQLAVLTPKVK